MDIKDFLAPTGVALDIRETDKKGLLGLLAAQIAPAAGLSTEVVAMALEKRDELGSTGFGDGVAVPHARFADLAKPVGFLAHLGEPMEFDAVDGKPVDIVFVLLLPATVSPGAPNALALVARKLRDKSVLHGIRQAGSKTDLYAAISG